MRRRTFFSTSAAAGLALGRGPQSPRGRRGNSPARFRQDRRKLTIIGQAGGRFPMCSYEDAKAITRRAYDLGINYFDCARIYWNGKSEEVYGDVLPPFRKQIFLTTKSPERSRKGAEADLEKSLRALKTDYLDLWQIHQVSEMSEVHQIFAPGGAIEAFVAAKKDGKCRFIGFTGHHDPEVHLAMLKNFDAYDTILMPLNPADPSYLSFEKMVLPVAVQRGLGIQAMKSTANAGLLSDLPLKDCLTYVLSLPVHCLALGCTTIGQVEDDVRIAQQFQPMPAAQIRRSQGTGQAPGRSAPGKLETRCRAKGLGGPVSRRRNGLSCRRKLLDRFPIRGEEQISFSPLIPFGRSQPQPPRPAEDQVARAVAGIVDHTRHRRNQPSACIHPADVAPYFPSLADGTHLRDRPRCCSRLENQPIHRLAVRILFHLDQNDRLHWLSHAYAILNHIRGCTHGLVRPLTKL